MESSLFIIGLLIVMVTIFRHVWRRMRGPMATVRGLLRHYYVFERLGFPETECLYRVLARRSGWKNLPHKFLVELINRLRSKENVFRFVSLAEGYRFDRKQLPGIAANADVEAAMREVALWLVEFGDKLQQQNRLKEAEFVQKLARGLQPNQYFTTLPMATTYYKMARYDEAAPLFKEGLGQLEKCKDGAMHLGGMHSGANLEEARAKYREMFSACLKASEGQQDSMAG